MQELHLRNMTSIYVMNGEKVLLLYRIGSSVANKLWIGTAGGHFEEAELNDPKACVERELFEETGLTTDCIKNMSLRYITLRLIGNEIRQNYFFFANLKNEANLEIQSNEGNLEWFDLNEAGKLKMPYTAQAVIKHFTEIGQFNDKIYAGNATENGVVFSALKDI